MNSAPSFPSNNPQPGLDPFDKLFTESSSPENITTGQSGTPGVAPKKIVVRRKPVKTGPSKRVVTLVSAIALVVGVTLILGMAWAVGGRDNSLFQAIGLATKQSPPKVMATDSNTKDQNTKKNELSTSGEKSDEQVEANQRQRQEEQAKVLGMSTKVLVGKKILLDPGHNGRNGRAQIRQQVPTGRGGSKPCNTDGTATKRGYPESQFNWEVAMLLKAKLEKTGAQVFMTRENNSGVGPCVDVRGQMAAQFGADLLLSIHANGSDSSTPHGFFLMVSNPPLNEAQGMPSRKLATDLSIGLKTQGLVPSTIFGDRPVNRTDLATLNHSKVPVVMAELGEMHNPTDAERMMSPAGRELYAEGLYQGLIRYFGG